MDHDSNSSGHTNKRTPYIFLLVDIKHVIEYFPHKTAIQVGSSPVARALAARRSNAIRPDHQKRKNC